MGVRLRPETRGTAGGTVKDGTEQPPPAVPLAGVAAVVAVSPEAPGAEVRPQALPPLAEVVAVGAAGPGAPSAETTGAAAEEAMTPKRDAPEVVADQCVVAAVDAAAGLAAKPTAEETERRDNDVVPRLLTTLKDPEASVVLLGDSLTVTMKEKKKRIPSQVFYVSLGGSTFTTPPSSEEDPPPWAVECNLAARTKVMAIRRCLPWRTSSRVRRKAFMGKGNMSDSGSIPAKNKDEHGKAVEGYCSPKEEDKAVLEAAALCSMVTALLIVKEENGTIAPVGGSLGLPKAVTTEGKDVSLTLA